MVSAHAIDAQSSACARRVAASVRVARVLTSPARDALVRVRVLREIARDEAPNNDDGVD
jgi:hypothetical protein